jgi:hypothetical protein
LILQAFVIATLLRVAQGSATVALTTTAGLLSAAVASANLGSMQLVALVVAIAAGATVLSHVNDSGFWLVSRFFNMDVKTTLKTWTVLETTLGLSAFVLALGLPLGRRTGIQLICPARPRTHVSVVEPDVSEGIVIRLVVCFPLRRRILGAGALNRRRLARRHCHIVGDLISGVDQLSSGV